MPMSASNQNSKKPVSKKAGTGQKKAAADKGAKKLTTDVILRRAYIALTVVSAIIVAVFLWWKMFAAAPVVTPPVVDGDDPNGVDVVARPQYTMVPDDKGNLVPVEIPGTSADRKEGFYTFLLVGQSQDTGGGLTDTMMLAAYDVTNQKLGVMSLPRDTYVMYNGRGVLLNSVYMRAGGEKDDKGIKALKREVQRLTGVYPDFHVIVQWEALGELVDAIGGVEFEVPFRMYYNDLSQHFKIDLQPGLQVLDGNGAMGLIRWRMNSIGDTGRPDYSYGYAEGDIGRIKTQQAFLKATIKKCLQPEVILSNLSKFIGIVQKNVVTDLSAGNMAYFAQSAISDGGLDMDSVSFTTLPYVEAGDGAHLLPVGRQIVKTVNEGFNPYKDDIHLSELTLADSSVVATPKPKDTPKPTESAKPSGSPDPSASPAPTESTQPSDTPLLPPGVVITTRPTRNPEATAKPTGSPKPTEGNTGGEASPSSTPNGGLTDPVVPPAVTQEPTPEPTPAPEVPTFTPPPVVLPPEDEPILPPGV